MRKTAVKIRGGEKEIIVKENRIKENEVLFEKWKADLDSMPQTSDMADMFLKGVDFLKDRLTEVFPDIEKEDIDESYQSEIEDLIKAWIDVNFFGLKQLAGKLSGMIQLATKTASYQAK